MQRGAKLVALCVLLALATAEDAAPAAQKDHHKEHIKEQKPKAAALPKAAKGSLPPKAQADSAAVAKAKHDHAHAAHMTKVAVSSTAAPAASGKHTGKHMGKPHAAAPSGAAAPAAPAAPVSTTGITMVIGFLTLIAACGCGLLHTTSVGGLPGFISRRSSNALQLGSFVLLICVQSTALLLFRLCQTSGSYTFSPASSVALTELCKLCLACSLHRAHVRSSAGAGAAAADGARPKDGAALWLEGVSPRIVAHYFGLAALYTANNQLTFYCLQLADPGTYALAKSLAPYLVAALLRFTGAKINQLQWACIILQCTSIATTQYDACKSKGVLSPLAYGLIALATTITAASSVWNQKVVKNFDVPINLQNAILYAFGVVIACVSYLLTPSELVADPAGGPPVAKTFFSGYNTLAVVLILFQAFHGLAVTFVYKYSDAIVKNFANSAVMAILVLFSSYYFHVVTTLHSWLGVTGVLVTTYTYMNIALKQ